MTLIMLFGLYLGYRLTNEQFLGKAQVDGRSMVPTYHDMDEGIYIKTMKPKNNDIAIFMMRDIPIIKRVIAIEGDTIEARKGKIYLNGKELEEPYIVEPWSNGGRIENKPLKLKKGEYFLMGDNRNASQDSRMEGVFTDEQFVGTMIFNTDISEESTILDQL